MDEIKYTIQELTDETAEIIQNAYESWRRGEIDRWQYEEVRNNALLEMGARAELFAS